MSNSSNSFIFVAHVRGGPTAREDKSIINAHVSRQSANRRRKTEASKVLHQEPLTKPLASTDHKPSTRTKKSHRRVSTQAAFRVLPIQFSPRSPLLNGNSDPFNSVSLNIDGKANQYLRFGGEILEAAIHSVGYRGWISSAPSCKDYVSPDLLVGGCPGYCGANNRAICLDTAGHSTACLKILGYGVLACCASGVASLTSNQVARNDALTYAACTMKHLREYLRDVDYDTNSDLELLVYRLYRAEILGRNYDSALAHGQLLRRIFEHRSRRAMLKLDMLSTTLYQDGQRMFGSWTRPIFDQVWVEKQYHAVWAEAEAMFNEDVDHEARKISKEVTDDTLRSILISVKQLFSHTIILAKRNQQAAPHNFYWFEARSEWLQLCLMNYYLDLDQHNTHEQEISSKVDRAIKMCLVLSVLCIIRHGKNEVLIEGRPLYPGCTQIVLQFDAKLSALAELVTQDQLLSNVELFTYILFVAALAEHYTEATPYPMRTSPFWRKCFGEFLVLNRCTSWSLVRPLIEKFPYTDVEVALPSEHWIEDLAEL